MKKSRKKKEEVFILYSFDEFTKDFEYIAEYFTIKELQEKERLFLGNDRSIYHYIKKNINKASHLLKDKYIIIKEEV
jgi:hypothetical protein